jgi:phosphatidylserine/phosphatidylglycerophosphate/cardiolipin synthase-like enzyme
MAHRSIDRLDGAVGAGIERLVRLHHRRRLARIGWAHAFDATGDWAAGDRPPRDGNAVEVLVDGEDALARIEAELGGARESVLLAGWAFTPRFRLRRDGPELRELLADAAERADVRVLAWAGAPLPLFTPSRSEVRASRDELVRGTRIRMALDARERPMHCHHEKLVVVDGRVAFRRRPRPHRPRRRPARRLPSPPAAGHGLARRGGPPRGPLVRDVHDHLALRWREVAGDALPDRPSNTVLQGGVRAQLVRTVPEHVYDALPRGDFRILESYLGALRRAERLARLPHGSRRTRRVLGPVNGLLVDG